MTYQFDAEVAKVFGVDEAIMIYNLGYWIRKNEANGKHFHNGRYWTYNSIEAFVKLFPFWTARQIRRILKSLEEKGVIITGNYNTSAYDRTTWYAFSEPFLRNCQVDLTKTSNGNDQKVNSNSSSIDIDTNTNIKPNGKTDEELFPAETHKVTRPRKTSEQSCLFCDSRYADYSLFEKEFSAPEYANIDLVYYYHAVADWSAQKGKKMKDWIATARNFMRKDIDAKKLHTIGNAGAVLSPEAIEYLQSMA